jgi:eukaryotic-like serine/threonine-protein kinase
MTPERWATVDQLFSRCVALSEPERRALLDRECGEDPELRDLVQAMLRADATGEDALQQLVSASVAQLDGEPSEPWQGRLLGPYRIERQLGAGGMGTVFLARRADAEYERWVAIKVLSNAFASAEERRRFVSERQILANLSHPGIAQLLDGGTTAEGSPFLVMEYIDGVPIDEYCITQRLPLNARLQFFVRVCDAVQYAHQHLVIHRDIKPGNILVTADGTPKLLDFGIAKLLDASAMPRSVAVTAAGARLLTPQHASPEQLRGEVVTTASDVYSLGVLLYRLLTDRLPYRTRDGSAGEIERAVLDTPPDRLSAAASASSAAQGPRWLRLRSRPTVSAELENIVLKALRKEPSRRYTTAREFALDVECYLAHRPVAARPDSVGYRLLKFGERHTVGVGLTALAIAAFVASVGFHTSRLAQERDVERRERASADRVAQFMVDIFHVADPQSGESKVTARELLDRGYQAIDQELKGEPLLAAKLALAMGRAYGGLAMFDRAGELERQALALRRAHLAAQDPEVAEALHYLGSTLADRGDYVAARTNLEEALGIEERALGPDAVAVGDTLTRLAFVDLRQSRYPAMRAALDRSLAIHLKAAGPDDRRTADVYALLGAYHWVVGEYPAARDAVGRALAIEEGAAAPNSLRIAGFVHTLGLLAWQTGDYSRAMDLYGRELAVREAQLGPEHPSVALPLYGLGVTSANLGMYRDSLAYFRRAAALQEKTLGPDSHYLAMTLGGYGFTLLDVGDLPAARQALARSLAIFQASFGPQHPDLRAPLVGLAKVAAAEHHFEEARALLERALAIVEAKFPPEHPDVLRTRVSLGDVYRAQGDYARSLEYYEPSVLAFQRTLGLNHPYAVDALCGMSDALARLGQPARAAEYYAKAHANLAAQNYADRRAEVAECLRGDADLLRQLGQRVAADEATAQADRIRGYLREARAD